MKYTITAPSKSYNRTVCGVTFISGRGQTESGTAAQWFSGRSGFTVETEKKIPEKKNKQTEE